jgi:hypothetical protein
LFRYTCKLGLEGIVVKGRESALQVGTDAGLDHKVKNPEGARSDEDIEWRTCRNL